MRVDQILEAKRDEIQRLAAKHGAYNVRVFGSVARGEAGPASDIDLLVDVGPNPTPFFPGGLLADLEELLGCKVDVLAESGLHWYIRDQGSGSARGRAPVTDDRLYLIHIRECLDRIRQYTAEGQASFFDDIKTQDAVLRNLQTLAESTQRLSEAAKASHQEVD
jgi:predicted nucleotidyltransferase